MPANPATEANESPMNNHYNADAMTETELRAEIKSLEANAELGNLTQRDAMRLQELKAALNTIRRALRHPSYL